MLMKIKIIIRLVLFENNKNLIIILIFYLQLHGNKKNFYHEEFKSLGFYISNHPLSEYENIFKDLNINSYDQFLIMINEKEGLVAGTIMSIIEKKSNKGTPYAIVKFSDQKEEFELFLFAEILINNRDKIKRIRVICANFTKR